MVQCSKYNNSNEDDVFKILNNEQNLTENLRKGE